MHIAYTCFGAGHFFFKNSCRLHQDPVSIDTKASTASYKTKTAGSQLDMYPSATGSGNNHHIKYIDFL